MMVHRVVLTLFVQAKRYIFSGAKMSKGAILFKKKAYLSDKKQFWPIFPRVTEKTDLKQPFLGCRRFYSNHCSSYKTTSVTPKVLLKAQVFGKKGKKSDERTYWPMFPRIIDYEKPQGTKNCVHYVHC